MPASPKLVTLKIPTNKSGIQWQRNPEFIKWFQSLPHETLTNEEVVVLVREKTNVHASRTAMKSLKSALGLYQSHATKSRSMKEAHSHGLQRIRTLGPTDTEHYVTVTGDAIVTSDWHVPYHDVALVEKMCAVAKRLKIQNLVINGDFLNEDAFSKWKGHPFQIGWSAEKEIARALLTDLCKAFKTIYYTMDNHDRRIIWSHDKPSEFTEGDVLDLIADRHVQKQIKASVYYHHVTINDTWRVTSPKEYRRAKLALPNRLAQLYHTNIISGGDHLFGLGMDDSGRYVCANNMCLVSKEETPYINTQDTSYPHWNRGFYVIHNNKLHPFVDQPLLWPTWWEHINVEAWRRG